MKGCKPSKEKITPAMEAAGRKAFERMLVTMKFGQEKWEPNVGLIYRTMEAARPDGAAPSRGS